MERGEWRERTTEQEREGENKTREKGAGSGLDERLRPFMDGVQREREREREREERESVEEKESERERRLGNRVCGREKRNRGGR